MSEYVQELLVAMDRLEECGLERARHVLEELLLGKPAIVRETRA